MAKTKLYQHFCPVARSLEVIGEKWSLLIVRDLLGGDRRFTDLMRGLSNITPKWLTMRLRELEEAGIVERAAEPGKREVWYRLSPRGRELGGVIAELNAWGLRFAMRPPHDEETVGDGRFGRSLLGYLTTMEVALRGPRSWKVEFSPARTGWFLFDGTGWSKDASESPDVTVRTSPREWANAIGLSGAARREAIAALDMNGDPAAIREFVDTISAMTATAQQQDAETLESELIEVR